MLQGVVPLRKIRKIRVNTAISQSRRGGTLVFFDETIAVFCISISPAGHSIFSIHISDCAHHVQRPENSVSQKLSERFSGNFRRNQSEHYVSRIAVRPACPRRKLAM